MPAVGHFNLEHLYGSEAELAAQVENFFTRRGYGVRIAVANTVGLAWAMAHFPTERAGSSPSPAEDCIPSLPVEALRIAGETVALLRELGIETVGQLLSLPREDLTSRFGERLLLRLDQLTGAAREVIQPHRSLAALEATCALDEPTADRSVLMQVLNQLVKRLVRQLAARDEGAVLLVCVLHSMGSRAVSLRIGLLQPSAQARQLLELIELHLETVALPGEVDRVKIRVAVVGRLGERQRELFAERWPSDSYQLALLVNRLSSRLGDERVLRAELRASPVPERAVRWMPVTGRDRETRRQGWLARSVSDGIAQSRRSRSGLAGLPLSLSPCLSPRPLSLHSPEAIEVVSVAPDGPPQFVWLDRRRERIVQHAGPERIETLWWRGPSVRRDYYRVATESGRHLWIFRRLTDARWFLHGTFA